MTVPGPALRLLLTGVLEGQDMRRGTTGGLKQCAVGGEQVSGRSFRAGIRGSCYDTSSPCSLGEATSPVQASCFLL